jgi:hypothetical protein
MSHAATIRRFLARRHGYYCEACLAPLLRLSTDEIRRSTPRDATADVVIRRTLVGDPPEGAVAGGNGVTGTQEPRERADSVEPCTLR